MQIKTKREVYTVNEVSEELSMSHNPACRLYRKKKPPGVIHLGN